MNAALRLVAAAPFRRKRSMASIDGSGIHVFVVAQLSASSMFAIFACLRRTRRGPAVGMRLRHRRGRERACFSAWACFRAAVVAEPLGTASKRFDSGLLERESLTKRSSTQKVFLIRSSPIPKPAPVSITRPKPRFRKLPACRAGIRNAELKSLTTFAIEQTFRKVEHGALGRRGWRRVFIAVPGGGESTRACSKRGWEEELTRVSNAGRSRLARCEPVHTSTLV